MAQQTFTRGLFVPWWPNLHATAPTLGGTGSTTIDAINEILAMVIRAPKAGDIRSVSFRMGGVTTGATITIGAYQVDTTTGNPANTPVALATNTFITKAIATTDANDWVNSGNFTADATVTKGQLFAVCFINPGAAAGNMQFSRFADHQADFPYLTLFTGSWAKASESPVLLLHYSDASVAMPLGCVAMGDAAAGGINSTSLSGSTTPDHMGVRFQFPGPVRAHGAWIWADSDGDYDIRLVTAAWDGASSGLLASGTLDANCRATTEGKLQWIEFDAAVDLSANTMYRLVIVPSTATALTFYDYVVADANAMSVQPLGGANMHLTTAKDPNDDTDWTDFDNGSDGYRVPFMGLILDGISDGAGGGSGGGSVFGGSVVR